MVMYHDGMMYIMKTANVSTIRKDLSRILDAVRRGAEYEIRDRDIPIARLVPISLAGEDREGTLPPWMEHLRRTGAIRVGTLKPVPEVLKGFPPRTPCLGNAAVDAILEERRAGR